MPWLAKCASRLGGFCLDRSVVWRRTWAGEVMLVQPSVADEASAMPAFPGCPYLPAPPEIMDAEALSAHGPVRDSVFYEMWRAAMKSASQESSALVR